MCSETVEGATRILRGEEAKTKMREDVVGTHVREAEASRVGQVSTSLQKWSVKRHHDVG